MLGSELTAQLLKQQARLTLIIRDRVADSRIYLENLDKKANLVYGDITDFPLVERTIGEYEIETIFHLAAQTIVRIGNRSPLSTFESNIKGSWNVLEAARLHLDHLKSIIIASSDKAYGPSKILPYREDLPLRGCYPYDVSKACTDLLAQSYYKTYRLPVSIIRCGNLFGPGDLNFNRIIPGTILSLLREQNPIIRSDGKFIRNFFYIKDAVEGYLKAGKLINRSGGEAFNLGTKERYSVLEITNLIVRLMGSKLKPVIKNEVNEEIREQYLSINKAKKVLNWEPKYRTKEALKETIEWYRKYVG